MKKIVLIFLFVGFTIYGYKLKSYPHTFINKTNITIKDIYDGDTFNMLHYEGKLPVRLYGIDTPEKNSTTLFGKYYSKLARDFLISKLTNTTVSVNAIRYGQHNRQDSIVTVGKGKERLIINEELLKAGLAIVAEKYCSSEYLEKYLKLQSEASNTEAGFWRDKEYYSEIQKMIDKYKIKEKTKQ